MLQYCCCFLYRVWNNICCLLRFSKCFTVVFRACVTTWQRTKCWCIWPLISESAFLHSLHYLIACILFMNVICSLHHYVCNLILLKIFDFCSIMTYGNRSCYFSYLSLWFVRFILAGDKQLILFVVFPCRKLIVSQSFG